MQIGNVENLLTECSDFGLPVNCRAAYTGDWDKKRELGAGIETDAEGYIKVDSRLFAVKP